MSQGIQSNENVKSFSRNGSGRRSFTQSIMQSIPTLGDSIAFSGSSTYTI